MGWFKRKINHAYRLSRQEIEDIEKEEHDAYVKESKKQASTRGFERARDDYS